MKPRKLWGPKQRQSQYTSGATEGPRELVELVLRHSRRGEEREYSSVAQLVARK